LGRGHSGKEFVDLLFRKVYKARLQGTDQFFALKMIKMDNEKEGVSPFVSNRGSFQSLLSGKSKS